MTKHLKYLVAAILLVSARLVAQPPPVFPSNIEPARIVLSQSSAQIPNQESTDSMNIKRFNKTRAVQPGDNWLFGDIAIELRRAEQATVIIPRGPAGVDTGGTRRFGGPWGQYQIRITDGGKSETVYVSGGTCVDGAINCSLIFTPFFSHSAHAYSLGSATQGIQEAINDGCGLPNSAADWPKISGCHVIIPPRGKPYKTSTSYSEDYNIYGSIFFHTSESTLSGDGAVINHYGRGPGLVVGYLTPVNADGSSIPGFPASAISNFALDNTITGISFRSPSDNSSDPAYAGSEVASVAYSKSTHLNTITTKTPHGLRTGDMVTILFTDPTQFWGDVPSLTVVDAKTFTYYRDIRVDWAAQQTPGIVALAYEPVLDNASGTNFLRVKGAIAWQIGRFNNWFDFWDDERCLVEGFDNAAIPLNANVNWTGSFFFSGGGYNLPVAKQQLASVVTVAESNLTANYSNGFSFFNSNGLYVRDTVIQAQGLWQANISNVTGNYQGASFENIYTETGPSLNPLIPAKSPWPGIGNAGLIAGPSSGAAAFSIRGAGMGGSLPSEGDGSNQFVYSIVVNDVSTGEHSSPLPVMFGRADPSGTILVRWPRVANGRDIITYHVVRNTAPLGIAAANGGYTAPSATGCGGGSVGACGTVVVSLPQCSSFVCTFRDDVALASSPIASDLASQNYRGNFSFWPALGAITSGTPIVSENEISTVGVGAQVHTASAVPINYAERCRGSVSVFGGYTSCASSTDTTNGTDSALMLNDYNYGKLSAKGRLNFMARGKPQELITLSDADIASTLATIGYRPKANSLDAYIGLDGPKGGFAEDAASVAIGSPIAISAYIAEAPNDSAWKERLSANSKQLKVPVDFQLGIAHEISGPEVSKPSVPAPGFQKAYFRAGNGLCAVDSNGIERCMSSLLATSTPTVSTSKTQDVPWFTALHVGDQTISFPRGSPKASFFGVTLPFLEVTKQLTYDVVNADPTSTRYDFGIYSGTSGGICTLLAHTGSKPGTSAMTTGFHTTDWQEGSVILQPGRYYVAITASSTKASGTLGGESNQFTFAGSGNPDAIGNAAEWVAGELAPAATCPTDSYGLATVPAFAVH